MLLPVLLAMLAAAPGSPPGLCWAVGTWPMAREGRGAPPGVRARVEPAITRALPPDERGCFFYAFEDLDGDGRDELLVYVETFGWCGTAGCPLYTMRWNDRKLVKVSRTEAIRNVFLEPWSGRGLRPLLVERWGRLLQRVPASHGRYPGVVSGQNASMLEELPRNAREVPWIEAGCCATEQGVPDGIRCSAPSSPPTAG